MTPQEKAKELFYKVRSDIPFNSSGTAKRCVLIAVDEMLNEFNCTHIGYGKGIMTAYRKKKTDYWQQVKEELEKI